MAPVVELSRIVSGLLKKCLWKSEHIFLVFLYLRDSIFFGEPLVSSVGKISLSDQPLQDLIETRVT